MGQFLRSGTIPLQTESDPIPYASFRQLGINLKNLDFTKDLVEVIRETLASFDGTRGKDQDINDISEVHDGIKKSSSRSDSTKHNRSNRDIRYDALKLNLKGIQVSRIKSSDHGKKEDKDPSGQVVEVDVKPDVQTLKEEEINIDAGSEEELPEPDSFYDKSLSESDCVLKLEEEESTMGPKNARRTRKRHVKVETVTYKEESPDPDEPSEHFYVPDWESTESTNEPRSVDIPNSNKRRRLGSSVTIEIIKGDPSDEESPKMFTPRGRPKGAKPRPKEVIEKEKAEKQKRSANQEPRATAVFYKGAIRADKKKECHICKKLFSTTGNLNAHIAGVHSEGKKHMCSFCGKTFSHRYDQRRHENLIHLKVSKHKCPEEGCEKIFASNQQMHEHRNAIHLGLRPFVCQYCGKTYGFRSRCYDHVKIMHEGAPPRIRIRDRRKNKDVPRVPKVPKV